ncbi:MAG TPA: oxygenase MpaB family protein [Parvibaculum sp.]|jgi:uncharacterized protein (DUF2236 family)
MSALPHDDQTPEAVSAVLRRDAAPVASRKGKSRPVMHIDFLTPTGDPGLSGPGSVTWRVYNNPVGLAVGGIAAVILELAEPAVRAGVWDHSTFKVDPIKRMENTGLAAMAVTYGPKKAAQMTFDRVTRMHQRVTGTTHEGVPYRAMDPKLLTWVHVTAAWGFLNAHIRYVEPEMSRADQDRYYAEGEIVGKGFGAQWVPTTADEIDAYMKEMLPKLYVNDTVPAFLKLVGDASPFGPLGRPFQRLFAQAAIDLLTPEMQAVSGVYVTSKLGALLRPTVRGLAKLAGAAVRLAPDGPPQQACRRMEVSTDCLKA